MRISDWSSDVCSSDLVNDTLGHPVGDQLLQQVAGRLTQIVGDKGQVGRLGGDEFQIVVPQMSQPEKLAGIANALILSLAKPFSIAGEQVRVGASIGIAVSAGQGVSASAPVRHARSEEHRVGKGSVRRCISRWAPFHSQKQETY